MAIKLAEKTDGQNKTIDRAFHGAVEKATYKIERATSLDYIKASAVIRAKLTQEEIWMTDVNQSTSNKILCVGKGMERKFTAYNKDGEELAPSEVDKFAETVYDQYLSNADVADKEYMISTLTELTEEEIEEIRNWL